jgi:hypothetical protein
MERSGDPNAKTAAQGAAVSLLHARRGLLGPGRERATAVRARGAMKHAIRVPEPQACATDHGQQHSLPPFASSARGPPSGGFVRRC